jgi:hypothetical protein
MFTIRWQQGRLHEIAPIVRFFVANNPASASWQPGLAIIYASIGERTLCREIFEDLAADSFASVPRDAMRMTSLAYLTETCVFLGDSKRADILYELFLPYDGRAVVVGGEYEYAAMLLARGNVDDRGRAMALLDEALAAAQAMGMGHLVQKVMDVQARSEFA